MLAAAAAGAADGKYDDAGDCKGRCNVPLKGGIRPETRYVAAVCGSESLGFKSLKTALKCFGLTSTGRML